MKPTQTVITAALIGLTAACQTVENYTLDTVPTVPARSSIGSEPEFAAHLVAHYLPRGCRHTTSRGPNEVRAHNQLPAFHFFQVIASSENDGWYLANYKPELGSTASNTLEFFVNVNTRAWACGAGALNRIAQGYTFSKGKFYDVNLHKKN